jgi:hypothetical protein
MIEGLRVSSQFLAFNLRHLHLTLFPRTIPGASALAFGLLAFAWTLPRLAPDAAEAPVVASAPKPVPNPFGAVLVDMRSRLRSASASATLARRAAPVLMPAPVSKPEPIEAARLVLSVPAIAPAPALRLSQNTSIDMPLPPRRSEEWGSPASPAPSTPRLAEAENLPVPPRRPDELKSEAFLAAPSAPSAENVPPTPSVVQLSENAPENLPLPPRRPDELGAQASLPPPPPPPVRLSAREAARQRRNARTAVAAAPPADNRTFLEKLFGGAPQSSSPALGYAPAEGGVTTAARSVLSSGSTLARGYDQYTAVYDISAHTVYLPSGARLEAHSGLGARLDDPRYVHEKMRGPTPPTVYALTPREQLFHGVQALRLTPLGGNVFGRAGLLAHTFMLGPNGDSNGCVSFRNYQAFLQAYQNGEIRRLAVVASLN